jgi:hypothetical protein
MRITFTDVEFEQITSEVNVIKTLIKSFGQGGFWKNASQRI